MVKKERKKGKKNWVRLISWIAMSGVAVVLIYLAWNFSKRQTGQSCLDVVVELDHVNGIEYIKEDEVRAFILANNDKIVGEKIGSLDLDSIEQSLNNYPFVRKAEVYIDLDRKVHVDIEQITPILRVHPSSGSPYYLSQDGDRSPLSKYYSAHVIVASGEISEAMDKKLYTLIRYVNDSKLWNAQIEQIFVSKDQDITLIPKLGQFSIILGDVDQLESKFNKLETFFRKGLNKTGWEKYKSLNLKYNKLVICK